MRKRSVVAALAVGAITLSRARRGWFPVRVEGTSMLPTLRPGDLLAVRALRPGEPQVGQLVVVRTGSFEIVKRVSSIAPGEIWLAGDNAAASTDSRTTGPAARGDLIGVVRARYMPFFAARRFVP